MKTVTNPRNFSRRKLIEFSAMALGSAAVTAAIASASHPVLSQPPDSNQSDDLSAALSPEEVLEVLMAGNKRFVQRKRENPNQSFTRITEVARGQKPFASILSCADSRVPVEILFDRGFGDLFVVRDAGNIATPEETGSLEFGTLILGSKVLMVMGHENCGAVKATIDGNAVPGQIGSIIDAIKPALTNLSQSGDKLENAVKANVLFQMERLKQSPVISQLIEEGKLKVVGGYYDLDTGEVSLVS